MASPLTYDALHARSGLPRLEARALLEAASARRREWLIAHGNEAASADCIARFDGLVSKRMAGIPIAYLLGEREFFGRSFTVTPAVLIPRIDTEVLAGWAIAHAPPGARMLDLGTGSGALAITVALERPDVHMLATDLSGAALTVAQRNARRLGADRVRWSQGSWWQAVAPEERFDLVLSNPPYIAQDDPHLGRGDLRFEPATALVAGEDGLTAYRAIFSGMARHLANGARMVVEHGHTQGLAVRALLVEAGLYESFTLADDAGQPRISGGTCHPHDTVKAALTPEPDDP